MPEGSVPLFVWAPGAKLNIPEGVGFSLPRYSVIQVHYNNPNQISGLSDSSGVRLKITSDESKIDYVSGFALLGLSFNAINIPARTDAYGLKNADSFVINEALVGVNVFASVVHAHLLGRMIRVQVKRNGGMLYDSHGRDVLGSKEQYDFNIQDFQNVSYTAELGDEWTITCIYKNTVEYALLVGNTVAAQDVPISGGDDTNNEMCIAFLAYYPYDPSTRIAHMTESSVYCDSNTATNCPTNW